MVECPGKAARTRRRRLAGTGLLRVESRLMRTRAVGVRGGLLTLVPFRNTTLLYHAKWQSQTPRELFFRFFSAARPDGLWRTAFGLWLWRSCGKEKPPTSADFSENADSGGEIAPSVWVTNPRARTFAPWGDWRTHNIHHVIMMSSESGWKSMRIHGAMRTGLPESGSAFHGTYRTAFPGRLAAFRSTLLHNKYLALSSFARH